MKGIFSYIVLLFVLPLFGQSPNQKIDSLYSLVQKESNSQKKADLLIDLGLQWREQSSDSALYYFDVASNYFDTTDQSFLRTKLYYHTSEVYLDIGQHDEAWKNLEYSITSAVTDSSKISTADILDKKADIKIRNGDYSEATDLLMEALPIFENRNDLIGLGAAFNSLGTIMERSQRLDDALEYYEKAFEFGTKGGDIRSAHGYLANMAIMHSMKGEHRAAVPLFQEVITYSRENGEKRIDAIASGNLGRVYVLLNRLDSAEIFINHSLSMFQSMGHARGTAAASSQLSRVYLKQNKNREVIDLLLPQYQFVKENNFVKFQERIAENLRTAYKNVGDYRNALVYTEILSEIKDSTVNKQMAQAVNDAQTKYETEKKEAEIQRLALEDQLNETRIQQQRFAIAGMGIGIALLSFLFYRLFTQKKKIDQQNKEKEVLLKEIHHRVKNNLQVISSLLKLQSRNVTDETTQEVLAEGQNRVRSMALIHQNLYKDDQITGIHMPTYISELCTELLENYSVQEKKVDLEIEVENINLDVDSVVPIGLIINELMTNSLKYAFDGIKNPLISVQMRKDQENLLLTVKDNGMGFDPESVKKDSLGMKLIRSFAKRLQADYILKTDQGTEANFIIKDFE